jgi:hypothetical protein
MNSAIHRAASVLAPPPYYCTLARDPRDPLNAFTTHFPTADWIHRRTSGRILFAAGHLARGFISITPTPP